MSLFLSLEHINFSYPEAYHKTIDDFNIGIEKNKITGLLGPNGAGKTTLIYLICGLLSPQSGGITFTDLRLTSTNQIKQSIGFVSQQDGLFAELTLRENLNYIGRLYDINKAVLKEKIEQYSERMVLTNHMNKKLRYFSGGMNRRANIISGLLHDPDFIILDEPTAGVDIQSRALIHEVIEELYQQGKTLLYTSHLLSEAEKLCHHFVIMDYGKLLMSVTAEELKSLGGGLSLEQYFLKITGEGIRD